MKGILIRKDNDQVVVEDIEYKQDDPESICKAIDCSIFTSAGYLENGDAVLVDDEGLITMVDDSIITKMRHYPQPLVGNIMIIGMNRKTGEGQDVVSTREEIVDQIEWSALAGNFR